MCVVLAGITMEIYIIRVEEHMSGTHFNTHTLHTDTTEIDERVFRVCVYI